MKKSLLIALTVAAVAISTPAFAVIEGSAHDITSGGSGISACEYCHTPHGADTTLVAGQRTPLWNRSNPTSTFTLYGTTVAGTTMTAVGPNSMTCLSCHDNVTAMGALLNNKGATDSRLISAVGSNTRARIGTDLRGVHPIGFTFVNDAAGPGGHGVPRSVFEGEAGHVATDPGFRLYGGTFQCASCHDPHDTVTGGAATGTASQYFLRAPWVSICTDCHADK